jgi:hypothetical protein
VTFCAAKQLDGIRAFNPKRERLERQEKRKQTAIPQKSGLDFPDSNSSLGEKHAK